MKLPSSTIQLYDNCKVLSPSGQLIFCCGKKRALWYVNRGIGDIVGENPLTIKLTFEPNGNGHANDEFYLQERLNICVVCGSDKELTKHHVVPYCYRKYFPDVVKQHSHHDILPLCSQCHGEYEEKALEFKKSLSKEYNIPINDVGNVFDKNLGKVRGAAFAILNYKEKIPTDRYFELVDIVKSFYKKDDITTDDLKKAMQIQLRFKNDFRPHAELMVKEVDLQNFVERWREHFLFILKPKYIPKYWDVKRSIYNTAKTNEKLGR